MTHHDDTQALLARLCMALGGTTVAAVMARHRFIGAMRVRHVACYIMHRRGMSYPAIARALNLGNHTSAMSGAKAAMDRAKREPAVHDLLEAEFPAKAPTPAEEAWMDQRRTIAVACNDLLVAIDRAVTGEGVLAGQSRRNLVDSLLRVRTLASEADACLAHW